MSNKRNINNKLEDQHRLARKQECNRHVLAQERETLLHKMNINLQGVTNLVFNQVRATARYSPKLHIWLKRAPSVNMAITDHIRHFVFTWYTRFHTRQIELRESLLDRLVHPLRYAVLHWCMRSGPLVSDPFFGQVLREGSGGVFSEMEDVMSKSLE